VKLATKRVITPMVGFFVLSLQFHVSAQTTKPAPINIPGADAISHAVPNKCGSDPFIARLTADRTSYAIGQPVNLTFKIVRQSWAAVEFLLVGVAHRDFRITVTSQAGVLNPNLEFTPTVSSGRPIEFPASGELTESDSLDKWFYALQPGSYEVTGEFWYKPACHVLRTNSVTISIKP